MATKDRTALKNDFANGKYATGEKFADLIDSMKVVQLPVVDPQALGTSLSFIDSISQDADGKITATKKTLDLENAHELNPFKGWYKTGDTLPTDGFDGAYLYFKDTSELTGQTTIYRWNGTAYADTGTVVDTSNVNTFETGQAVNAVAIDGTELKNPAGNALPKAEGVMQLAAKLEGVTAAAEKVQLVTSGAGQNVFAAYIPVKTISPNTKYIVATTSNNTRSLFVPVSGVGGIRFPEAIVTSQYVVTGYLFLNLGAKTPAEVMQSGFDCTNYVLESHEWEVGSAAGYRDKVIDVPEDATHFVTVFGLNALPESKFYCYKMTGVPAKVDSAVGEVVLDYGTVTGNVNSSGVLYDVNGRIGMKNEALSFYKYLCSPFIEASGFFNLLDIPSVHGVLLCYDKNMSYISQRKLVQYNTLPNGTEFIKLCVTTSQSIIPLTWELGNILSSGETTSENHIRSSEFTIEQLGTFISDNRLRYFVKFYDASHNYKGTLLKAPIGCMLTRGYLLNNYYADGTGGSIESVKYARMVCTYPVSHKISVAAAPAPIMYSPDDSVVTSIRYETIGGRIVKDRNSYGNTLHCVYDTHINKQQLSDNGALADTAKYYSTMQLRLPKNYSSEGLPTKLIIFKGGQDSYDDIFDADEEDAFVNRIGLRYWVDQGYAVMDFYASTSKYPNADCYGFATGIAAAVSAYEYVVKMFNIDPSGVYLSCKSLGGYISHELLYNGCIPIKAAALLAPAIDNKRYCFGYETQDRTAFVADMGLTGDASVLANSPYSDSVKAYIKSNIDKLLGYLPMLNGIINKTVDEWLELVVTTQGSFAEVKRIHRVPTKYWVAPDDTATPYAIAENYVMSCKNTFSPVYLRTMPSGTGGHTSTDAGGDSPKVASITTRLGVTYTNVPVAYVEALDFLERY